MFSFFFWGAGGSLRKRNINAVNIQEQQILFFVEHFHLSVYGPETKNRVSTWFTTYTSILCKMIDLENIHFTRKLHLSQKDDKYHIFNVKNKTKQTNSCKL